MPERGAFARVDCWRHEDDHVPEPSPLKCQSGNVPLSSEGSSKRGVKGREFNVASI